MYYTTIYGGTIRLFEWPYPPKVNFITCLLLPPELECASLTLYKTIFGGSKAQVKVKGQNLDIATMGHNLPNIPSRVYGYAFLTIIKPYMYGGPIQRVICDLDLDHACQIGKIGHWLHSWLRYAFLTVIKAIIMYMVFQCDRSNFTLTLTLLLQLLFPLLVLLLLLTVCLMLRSDPSVTTVCRVVQQRSE